MMLKCSECFDRDPTRHSVKYLRGDKESYYEIKCCRCKKKSTVESHCLNDLKVDSK
jgi:hypothetical protein